jgi:TRAP-type C4-dicarboxylate transport system substrate-binding protein
MKLLMTTTLATLLALPALAQDMPATEFNVVGSIGGLSMYTDRELPFWTEQVPAETDGKITANVKPFTELGFKGGEIFRLVSNGTLQIATTVLAYNSGEVPRNEATDLVGLLSSVEQLAEVADAWRPSYAEFLEKEHNIKLLGFGTYQAQVIYCRDEFKSLADLAGRKVRASGASQQAFVSYLGGSPLSIAFAEVQPSLASGVVDCAITGALSGYKAKWHESAKFISPMPVNFGLAAQLANLDWWNGLDASVHRTI